MSTTSRPTRSRGRGRTAAGAGCLALLAAAGIPSQTSADRPAHVTARERPQTVRLGVAPQPPGSAAVAAVVRSDAPASVTTPDGGAAEVGVGSIPAVALAAYQRAEVLVAQVAPECRLPWTLLAGIGRAESDHGRHRGSVLGEAGVSSPRIIGVRLDGRGRVAKVRDHDAGRLDGDRTWDRAVGPMQLLPGSWASAGVDGDSDGVRSPHDIDDAALAAAVHLCAGAERLDDRSGMRTALLRYNHARAYATLVMAYERQYRVDALALTAIAPWGSVAAAVEDDQAGPATRRRQATVAVEQAAPEESAPGTTDRARAEPVKPAASATAGPTPAGTSSSRPSEGRVPTPDPAQPSTPTPAPRSHEGGESSPAPTTSGPEPTSTPSQPTPTVDATLVTLEGPWTACDTGYCVEGTPLPVGDVESWAAPAVADYDGDAQVEEYGEELAGLVDRIAVVVIRELDTGSQVVSINGLGHVPPTPAE